MIRVENIKKSFKNHTHKTDVLINISLNISEGNWTSIVGPSGSGKSTLLNCISGLQLPDSGKVFYENINLFELSESKRNDFRKKNIGFVFQDFKLLPYYSVLDNVTLPLLDRKNKRRLNEQAKSLLETVGIEDKLFSRLPESLSGGEKQRVAITRALMGNPKLLICDEPTGNLDQANREIIVELLLQLKKRGKTIVLVTHDLDLANKGDNTYHLTNGSLSESVISV